ncbi:MAG: monophosphatase [Micromonosporaceae bacterium]|jgi:myo-inositol-1(or 4)-monophosphatase|nr:monophosphatase [Micromonosporaceae bacterium]
MNLLPVAARAVDTASAMMKMSKLGSVIAKGERDLVSDVDFAIERRVREFLAEQTPDIGFVGEEDGVSGVVGGLMWALDPVDGTVNYVRGHPLCAVSLALLDRSEPVLGVIDLALLGRRYHAVRGRGAFADVLQEITTSTVPSLQDAVVAIGDYAVGTDSHAKNRLRLAVTAQLSAHLQRIRMHGSAAVDLAWLAEGRVDAVVICSNSAWDIPAGVAIAREAGAVVVDFDGADHTVESTATIAAGPAIIADLLDLVRAARFTID